MRQNCKSAFYKSQELLTEQAQCRKPIHTIHYSYFNGRLCNRHNGFGLQELPAQEASSFCDFLKIYLLPFHHIFLIFDSRKTYVF